ncbi:MAG: CoA transferase [Rhizomicrobium sp.]
MSAATDAMLRGIKILDLTTIFFGPYATRMLADLGAEVIKVEAPGGDAIRYSARAARTPGMSPAFMALNTGKKSVVLDLKSADGQAAMRRLVENADVFIHNIRQKAIDALGFGYAQAAQLKPGIVYVHCTGFGSDGPYADLQAYDDVIQAATGTATLAGLVDGDPKPRYIPSLIADKVAGLHAAHAVLAALVHKLRTGQGQFVEVPMFESFAHFMLLEHLGGATFEPPTAPWGYSRQLDPHRQPFPTSDGFITIVPYTDETVRRVFEVLGAPHLLSEARFATARDRARNMSAVYAEIAKLTPARTTAEWCERLRAARIPAMAVRDLADMLDDPHLAATAFFRRRVHSTEGAYIEMQPAIRFSAGDILERREPPRVGEHTDEILGAIKAGSPI